MARKDLVPAVAYLRTSSAANVESDRDSQKRQDAAARAFKDSEKRQTAAIRAFAKAAGYEIVDVFYDAAVSGADPLDSRPGFAAMLKRIEANGVRTIIVETASRFARDLIVQETGHERLKGEGIDLIAADSPAAFKDD